MPMRNGVCVARILSVWTDQERTVLQTDGTDNSTPLDTTRLASARAEGEFTNVLLSMFAGTAWVH